MKKVLFGTLFVVLVGLFFYKNHIEAKWEKTPNEGRSIKAVRSISVGGVDIWAIVEGLKEGAKTPWDNLYLVKWNNKKKDWMRITSLDEQAGQGVLAASADGSVFISMYRRMTDESQKKSRAIEDAVEQAFIVAIEAKLEKLEKEKVIPKRLLDNFSSVVKKKPYEALGVLFNDADFQKLDKNMKTQILNIVYDLGKKIRGDFEPEFTAPLIRFVDGKQKIIHDFGEKKEEIWSMAAAGKNRLFILRVILMNGGSSSIGIVEQWDGSSWKQIGKNLKNVDSISVGVDGSLYAAGSYDDMMVFKWDGSLWKQAGIKFDPEYFSSILDMVVLNDQDIWFTTDENSIYRWNGKVLKRKFEGELPEYFSGSPGFIVGVDDDANVYKWIE